MLASRETLLAEVAEEPLSGTFVPLALDDGKVLLGTALRRYRFALTNMKLYAFAVYCTPEDFWQGDIACTSASADDLLSRLVTSRAEKVLCLIFLRSLTGKEFGDGIADELCKVGQVPRDEVDLLFQYMPVKFPRGSELRFTLQPEQGQVSISVGATRKVSLGNENLCRGIHEIFFGPQAALQGLGESLQRQQLLLASREILSSALLLSNTSADNAGSIGNSKKVNAQLERAPNDVAEQAQSRDSGSNSAHAAASTSEPSESSMEARHSDASQRSFSVKEPATVTQRRRTRTDNSDVADAEDFWPAAVVAEGEDAAWAIIDSDPKLNQDLLAMQSLKGTFSKHHGSAVRGRLLPQWSVRYYELKAGILQYRRRAGGKICGSDSLNGARVVTEPPKLSRAGSYFVFRIIMGSNVICRLSSPDHHLAEEWVSAVARACAYFRALRVPGEEPRIQVVAQALQDNQEPEQDDEGNSKDSEEEQDDEQQWEMVAPVDRTKAEPALDMVAGLSSSASAATAAHGGVPPDREEVSAALPGTVELSSTRDAAARLAPSDSPLQYIAALIQAHSHRLAPALVSILLIFLVGRRLRRRCVAPR